MNEWLIALQVAQLVVTVILGLFISSYLPAYFAKKGENLATKEDISEITEQVERIKTIYSAELETFRASTSQNRLEREEYLRERKSCALTFYDLAVELIYEKLAINFGDSPVYKGEFLATFRSSFYNLISSLIKSYQRIVVYFPYDDSLRVKAEGVLAQALESRRVFKKHFGGLVVSFINESEAFKSRKGMDLAVEASNEASTEYWRAMNPVIEQMQQSLRLYLTALNGFLRPNEPAEFPSAMLLFDE